MLDLDQRIDDLEEVLTARLRRHPQTKILTSLPGIGVLLATEFLVAVGDLASLASANHLAAYAGLARSRGVRTASAAGLLSLCPDQCATSRPVAGLLPAQTP